MAMSHILSLLTTMRSRPGMYLGTPAITRLAAFLRGYDYAVAQLGAGKSDQFLVDFRDWIHQRFQSTAYSWEDTILRHSADEADALRHFWQLLDEYLDARRHQFGPPEIQLTASKE
jgi:hypothetical protein